MTDAPAMLPIPGERAVKEWIGRTPDTAIPPRVRLRVLKRFEFRCYLTGEPIREGDAWDIEHVIAITNGGENRESNLAPALRTAHREKTRQDVRIKAKRDNALKKRFGLKAPKRPMPGGRNSNIKITMAHGPVDRRTGKPIKGGFNQ